MGRILLQPPELDTKRDAELGDLQTEVPSIAITKENDRVRHVIEIRPSYEIRQDIDEHQASHPAIGGVADAPLASDSVTLHVLELGGGHVA